MDERGEQPQCSVKNAAYKTLPADEMAYIASLDEDELIELIIEILSEE